jgi:hypothetical protein
VAAPCGASILICALRATRLDSTGAVVAPPDNVYVTDAALQVNITPTYEPGADLTLTGGCDCKIASYKGTDKFKFWELEVTEGKLEPALEEMLLGGTVITGSDGSDTVPVGVAYPGALACDEVETVAQIEFWTKHINGDTQDPTFPWIWHVYPQTRWTKQQQSYSVNEFAQPVFSGFTRQNLAWGTGPFTTALPAAMPNGGYVYSATDPPTVACDYQDETL